MSDLRERKGYTYGIYSRLSPYRSAGVFSIKTQVRTEVGAPALKDILGHLELIRKAPVSAEELKQAKNTLAGRFVRDLETQEGLADAVLHGILHDLPEGHLDTFVQNVQAVGGEDVRRAAREWLRSENLLVTAVGDGAKIATRPADLHKELRWLGELLQLGVGKAPGFKNSPYLFHLQWFFKLELDGYAALEIG